MSDEQSRRYLDDPEKLRDLIATLWLYIGRHEEKQLTTEQKELFADVVEHAYDDGVEYHRWWREDHSSRDRGQETET